MSFNNLIQAACLPDNNTLYPPLNSAGAIAGWGRTNGSYSSTPLNLRNVKVYVADVSTNFQCLQFALLKNSIVCLGFYILRLKLEFKFQDR